MDGQQLADVAVEVLQLAQVDLVPLHIVGQRLVQGDQVLQVHAQDGHLEPGALAVHAPVVTVVAARRQQLRHLTQGLGKGGGERK